MIYLFFILVGLAIFHLFYESVIAPSLRMKLRFELFEIRDDLRSLKINEPEVLSDQVYAYLQDCVNNGLNILHRVNISFLQDVDSEIERNPHLKERVEKRIRLIEASDESVSILSDRIGNVGRQALLINTGGWFIYILPIFLVYHFFERIKSEIVGIVALPSHELDPEDELVPAFL